MLLCIKELDWCQAIKVKLRDWQTNYIGYILVVKFLEKEGFVKGTGRQY